ncbi:hypothetical protein [Halorussus caseinilyticus]|uniref:Uncharacterized protein n=1 Tax=Halorussus caseinilyticus TaxID=3034025 RepID=A0ABD5WNQ3_9EURY
MWSDWFNDRGGRGAVVAVAVAVPCGLIGSTIEAVAVVVAAVAVAVVIGSTVEAATLGPTILVNRDDRTRSSRTLRTATATAEVVTKESRKAPARWSGRDATTY